MTLSNQFCIKVACMLFLLLKMKFLFKKMLEKSYDDHKLLNYFCVLLWIMIHDSHFTRITFESNFT